MKKYAIILLIALLAGCEEAVVREPAVAGSWYPGDESSILSTIDNYFANAPPVEIDGRIKAIIAPHAGWKYSGFIAAAAFKLLEGTDYKTVIVIGPSHTDTFSGASIPPFTHYKTPLGTIRVSDKIKTLLGEPNFISHSTAHLQEHSIEIELPFLQKTLKDFELIPVLVGSNTPYEQLRQIADSLKKIIDDSTLIVISSDFTHFGFSYGYMPFTQNIEENLKKLDQGAVDFIANKDPLGFYDYVTETGVTICGKYPIIILLNILQGSDSKVKLGAYDTSGRQANDFSNSVSYISLIFHEKGLSQEEKEFLLKLARQTVDTHVNTGQVPKVDDSSISDNLKKVQGCFVTLNKHGQLRGCIGHILPQEPLYQCVIDNAVNAAAHDSRFNEVRPEELSDIEVEVSVLSVPSELEFSSSDDLLNKLRPNADGVVISYQGRQSTYLPQVWEQMPDKETFLSSLCEKQGSLPDCWKQPDVKISVYQALVFHEE